MTKFWQIYYNAVFGALGGLIAWFVVGLFPTTEWPVHLANMFAGAGVGLLIGGSLGTVEGLLVKRSWRRAVNGALVGGLTGMVGGAIGLLFGGIIFIFLRGGLLGRILGWMFLGLFLGLGQNILGLKMKRAVYGLLGGTIAGLIGGALYEIFTQTFLEQSGKVQVFLAAVGIVLIGMCLGAIITLTFQIAREGLVVILNGRRANTEINVIADTTIGSSDGADVYIPDDKVEQKQALISKQLGGFVIKNIGRSNSFYVDDKIIAPNQQVKLAEKAQFYMGDTTLKFQAH